VEANSIVFPQLATFASDQNAGEDLDHETGGNSGGRVARPRARRMRSRSFRLVQQIDRGDGPVGDQLGIGGDRKLAAISINPLTARLVNQAPVRFSVEGEPDA